jgi:hypothetical protein
MLETYSDLVAYWEALPTTVQQLRGATVGNDEAIANALNTGIKYPHLWVETPDIDFRGDEDNPVTRFRFGMCVLINDPRDTNTDANRVLSETLEILKRVYQRVYHDADDAELFDLVTSAKSGVPIRKHTADNQYGWRLEVAIELPRALCDDCD